MNSYNNNTKGPRASLEDRTGEAGHHIQVRFLCIIILNVGSFSWISAYLKFLRNVHFKSLFINRRRITYVMRIYVRIRISRPFHVLISGNTDLWIYIILLVDFFPNKEVHIGSATIFFLLDWWPLELSKRKSIIGRSINSSSSIESSRIQSREGSSSPTICTSCLPWRRLTTIKLRPLPFLQEPELI